MINTARLKTKIRYILNYFTTLFNGKAEKSDKYLKSVKGIYEGERCFIIGNGPSLTAEDLDMLKDEYTFASNRIFNIFSKTDWRPTYYAIFDGKAAAAPGVIDSINALPCEMKFVRREGYHIYKGIKEPVCFVHTKASRKYLDSPVFSDNPADCVYTIAIVTYTLFQLAAYMGFKEIYLLGMDNRYAFTVNRDGSITENKDVLSHFDGDTDDAKKTAAPIWESDIAYGCAKDYFEKHGIKVYNATRGGYLEAFERKSFDEIIKET